MHKKAFNNESFPRPSQEEVGAYCAAAREGDNTAVRKFLDNFGAAFVDEKSSNGEIALTVAAIHGHVDTVVLLLARGASPHKRADGRATALTGAAMNGHIEIVRVLLDAGAPPDDHSEATGMTALIWAAVHNRTDIAELLLDRGADIQVRDLDGYSAFDEAKSMGHAEMLEFLTHKAAEIERQKLELQKKQDAHVRAEFNIQKLRVRHPSSPFVKKRGLTGDV